MASKKRGRAKKIKKHAAQKKPTEVVYHSTKEIKVERALIENFIDLQKVMVSLSSKFDMLSSQISHLLQLFEVSAKTLARKEAVGSNELEAKKVMEKLDRLSSQAGLIGRGLALIHEVNKEHQGMKPSVLTMEKTDMQKPAFSAQVTKPLVGNIQLPMTPGKQPEKKMVKEINANEKGFTSGTQNAP